MSSNIIEKAEIERLILSIGEADVIKARHAIPSYGMGTFIEVYCKDPFTLRVHRTCEGAFGVGAVPYKGVLSSPLQESEKGYERFSKIAERLEAAFGKSIPHELEDYVDVLDRGLAVPLYTNHPNFFMKPGERKNFPKFPDLFKKRQKKSFKRNELKKIEEKGFLMKKIIEEHHKYEEAKKLIGNVNKSKKIRRRLNDYFDCFQEICGDGRWYQGLVLEYEEQNLENVFDFFGYVLEGGDIPNLPNTNPINKTQEPKEEPVEIESTETNFVDPWKIKIPKLDKDE